MQEDIRKDIRDIKSNIRKIQTDFNKHENWEESFLQEAFVVQQKLIENSEKNLLDWIKQKDINNKLNIKINISLFCISFIYFIIIIDLVIDYIWKI